MGKAPEWLLALAMFSDYGEGMRAARRDRYGAPEVIRIENLPVPVPADGELLIRVHATTVSRTDCALLAASPFVMRFFIGFSKPKRETLGTDFAGHVEALGAHVREFAVGDAVWGIDDLGAGSQAEYLVVASDSAVAKMPAGPSYEAAVACLEGAWYAYSMIERAGPVKGRRVLINGATGGIGSALLQLCVHFGATVTAVGNTKNLDLLKSRGAATVVDYETTDFTRAEQVRGEKFDYVFDAVGKSTFSACQPLLVEKGVYVSSELGPHWQNPWLAFVTPALGGKRVVFPFPIDRKAFLPVIHELVEQGHFSPVIDRVYGLETIRDAYAYVASGQKTGNVVLRLATDEG